MYIKGETGETVVITETCRGNRRLNFYWQKGKKSQTISKIPKSNTNFKFNHTLKFKHFPQDLSPLLFFTLSFHPFLEAFHPFYVNFLTTFYLIFYETPPSSTT